MRRHRTIAFSGIMPQNNRINTQHKQSHRWQISMKHATTITAATVVAVEEKAYGNFIVNIITNSLALLKLALYFTQSVEQTYVSTPRVGLLSAFAEWIFNDRFQWLLSKSSATVTMTCPILSRRSMRTKPHKYHLQLFSRIRTNSACAGYTSTRRIVIDSFRKCQPIFQMHEFRVFAASIPSELIQWHTNRVYIKNCIFHTILISLLHTSSKSFRRFKIREIQLRSCHRQKCENWIVAIERDFFLFQTHRGPHDHMPHNEFSALCMQMAHK